MIRNIPILVNNVIGSNPSYFLPANNCTTVSWDVLGKGTLSNGMNVGDYMGSFDTITMSFIPNPNNKRVEIMFGNSDFTKSAAVSSIKNNIKVMTDFQEPYYYQKWKLLLPQ